MLTDEKLARKRAENGKGYFTRRLSDASLFHIATDNYKGGEFIVAGNKYETKIGSGIIFPSNFMFPHEVKKITHGERWSIVTWLM